MTTIGIQGTEFTIDGQPTYAGRTYEGKKIQGLLFNARAAQAIFDDANPGTRVHWVCPDTGVWDAERDTDQFCDALPLWKAHGVLGFTVDLQGGARSMCPRSTSITTTMDSHPRGSSRWPMRVAYPGS
jgi:hypothetical protein